MMPNWNIIWFLLIEKSVDNSFFYLFKLVVERWTLPNFDQKKAPKIRREKETRGKDQSPAKQTAQKRSATKR